jgi:SOS-response transcriptional repressor LexA
MEPRVNPGDIVVIDPDMTLEPGDLVAVSIKSTGAVVFRQFGFAPGDRRLLSPINSHHRSYSFSEEEWAREVTILGVMTERTEQGKRFG